MWHLLCKQKTAGSIPATSFLMPREETERFSFDRQTFPMEWGDHVIYLLQNDAFIKDGNRLRVHLILYCAHCDTTGVSRCLFPPDYDSYTWATGILKFNAFKNFERNCKFSLSQKMSHPP